MFKRKNLLALVLALAMVLPGAIVSAQEVLPEVQADPMAEPMVDPMMDPMASPLAIPMRDASPWALGELVDSDRYGLYDTYSLYQGDLKTPLTDELEETLLLNFSEKLEGSSLEKVEKPSFMAEVENSKTRGGFLRRVYNILIGYEKAENLEKDPIVYLNLAGIVAGNGQELFLDRDITKEEAILFTKRATDFIYEENDLSSKGLMWKVEKGENTAYLLGAIHYGEPEMYPIRDKVLENFDDSQMLYVEIDITNEEALMEAMMESMEAMEAKFEESLSYQDGTRLDSVLDEELYNAIKIIMEKNEIAEEDYKNLTIQGVDQKLSEIIFEDSFEEMSEEEEAEFEKALEESMAELEGDPLMELLIEGPRLGVDFYFLDKAKTLNKEVGELETIESQLELIFGEGGLFSGAGMEMTEEEEIEMLEMLVENFDDQGNYLEMEEMELSEEEAAMQAEFEAEFEEEMEELMKEQFEMIDVMFESFRTGNADQMAEIFSEAEGAELFAGNLLGTRDENMAKKISELLEGEGKNTYFIVVGAAHYTVDGTIVDILTDMGYTVEKIN